MKRNFIASCAALFILIIFYTSCAKIDTTDIGNSLIPSIDNVNTFETTMVVISDNKLFTDATRMLYEEDHPLGIIDNDVEFGGTSATLYSSFTPTVYRNHPFTANRDSVILDSVILSLAHVSTFGDSNSVQQFEVREIDPNAAFTDSAYFLNVPDFPVLPEVLGLATINFLTLNDDVVYRNGKDTVRTASEMRISLDTTWARRFIDYDTAFAYASDTVFKSRFKGLEIRASESGSVMKNALAYFNLSDNQRTRITFYCRVFNNGITDTIAPAFTYTLDPHADIVRRTPAGGYLANLTNGVDNDEKIYLQASPGSYATLQIPGLENLDNRVIHRAELILDKFPSDQDFYSAPPLLFLDAAGGGDSAFTIRNDFIPINSAPGYDLNSLGGRFVRNQYVFNISRYLQSVITKKLRNYTLRVYAPFTTRPFYLSPNSDQPNVIPNSILINTPVAAGRVVLYGGGSADATKRLRLRIIYSTI